MTFCGADASVTVVPSSPVTLTAPDVGDPAAVATSVGVAAGVGLAVAAAVGVEVACVVGARLTGAVAVATGGGVCVGPPVPWQAVNMTSEAAIPAIRLFISWFPSDPAAVIRPVQQRLTLAPAAVEVAGLAIQLIWPTCRRIAFHRLIWRWSSSGMRRPM